MGQNSDFELITRKRHWENFRFFFTDSIGELKFGLHLKFVKRLASPLQTLLRLWFGTRRFQTGRFQTGRLRQVLDADARKQLSLKMRFLQFNSDYEETKETKKMKILWGIIACALGPVRCCSTGTLIRADKADRKQCMSAHVCSLTLFNIECCNFADTARGQSTATVVTQVRHYHW